MYENEIFMHENEIFMHENEFFAPKVLMGSWVIHNFMHGIFTHENILGKFHFLALNLSYEMPS